MAYKQRGGKNPIRKNFSSAFEQAAPSTRRLEQAETSEARGDTGDISGNLLNILEQYGTGSEYDISDTIKSRQDREAKKASDAHIASTTSTTGGADTTFNERTGEWEVKKGEADRIRAEHQARIDKYADNPTSVDYETGELEKYRQSIIDRDLAERTNEANRRKAEWASNPENKQHYDPNFVAAEDVEVPEIYTGTEEYAGGSYGSGASQIALEEAQRQGDLTRQGSGEAAIMHEIQKRQTASDTAAKTREKQATAEAAALEAEEKKLSEMSNRQRKKYLKSKDTPMEKSGFKMGGSYHYAKKRKV